MSFTTLGFPWNGIKTAIKSLRSNPTATVNVTVSYVIAGNISDDHDAGGSSATVDIQNYVGGNSVTHSEFTDEIEESLTEWKNLFESLFPGLQLNFVVLGDETGTSIPSDYSTANYNLDSGTAAAENIGDFRFSMHNIDGNSNVLGHGYSPGGQLGIIGNTGGDTHFDSSESWRLDVQSVSNAFSIKYVTVHELGHNLGLGHDGNLSSVMYPSVSPPTDFHTRFPSGLQNSTTERNAINAVYNVDSYLWAIDGRGRMYLRLNTTNISRGNRWRYAGRSFKSIAVSSLGSVYAVNRRNVIFVRRNTTGNNLLGSGWRRFSSGVSQISAGPENTLWATNRGGRVFRRRNTSSTNPTGAGWQRVGGRISKVAVGGNGSVWAIGTRGQLYYRRSTYGNPNTTGSGWRRIRGRYRDVSVGRDGTIWVVRRDTRVYRRRGVTAGNPVGTSWAYAGRRFIKISTNQVGQVYGLHRNGRVYQRHSITLSNPNGGGWSSTNRRFRHLDVGLVPN